MPNITTLFEGTDGATRENFNQKLSDVNAHGNDTSAHITTAIHTRTGTVNNLAVPDGAKNLTFLATGTIVDGDTWTVNGNPVTAVLQNGESLPGELFKAGCWVTGVRLSDDGAKLTFPGKGAMRGLTIGVGNGGTSATYTGAAAVSITIPRIVVSTSAPSSLLPTGTIHGVY